MPDLDLTRLQHVVWRYVRGEDMQQEVFQQAWLLAQSRTAEIHYKGLVMDAMRSVLGPRRNRLATVGLANPHRITSLYPTEAQLVERWEDEQTEDQIEEWLALPVAKRDERRAASLRALGTSPETEAARAAAEEESMAHKRRDDGKYVFTGKPQDWGRQGPGGSPGSTGSLHPFRNRAARQVREAEQRSRADQEVTLEQLEALGVPVGALETHEVDPLGELDRFAEVNGLEHRGIDVVLSRFESSRYMREEEREDGER